MEVNKDEILSTVDAPAEGLEDGIAASNVEESLPPEEVAAAASDLPQEKKDSADVEGEKAASKKSKVKKTVIYGLFILLNVVVILITLLIENKSGDMMAGREAFALLGKNWIFTALALFVFIIQITCDTTAFYTLTREVGVKKKLALPLSIKTSLIGKYYDKLTPWATGGQPAQMAYLSTHGLDTATGCSLPLVRSIIKVFAVGAAALTVLTVGGLTIIKIKTYMMVAAYLSVAGTLIFPLFFIIFMKKPELGEKLLSKILRLGVKLRLVKDYDKQYAKFSIMVNDFLGGMKYLSGHKKIIVIISITTLVDLFTTNMIPFLIIRAFGIQDVSFWTILVMCFFVTYASYFAPSPGAAGVAEFSFYAIFASVISDRYLFWALLFWRIVIYYIPIFVGAIMQISEGIKGALRKKRERSGLDLN